MATSLFSNPSSTFLKRPLLTAMMTALIASISVAGCSSPESSDTETTDTTTKNQTADDNATGTVTIDTVKGDVDLAVNPSPVVVYDMT
ncbi:MAG: siderophore ABC transporter substrate-binding protein, partial [Psychrobacter sp.]